MTLNLYLDDCMNSRRLAELLQQAGHLVVRPTDVGQGGRRTPFTSNTPLTTASLT